MIKHSRATTYTYKMTFKYDHEHKYRIRLLNNNQLLSSVYCKTLAIINKVMEDFAIPQM